MSYLVYYLFSILPFMWYFMSFFSPWRRGFCIFFISSLEIRFIIIIRNSSGHVNMWHCTHFTETVYCFIICWRCIETSVTLLNFSMVTIVTDEVKCVQVGMKDQTELFQNFPEEQVKRSRHTCVLISCYFNRWRHPRNYTQLFFMQLVSIFQYLVRARCALKYNHLNAVWNITYLQSQDLSLLKQSLIIFTCLVWQAITQISQQDQLLWSLKGRFTFSKFLLSIKLKTKGTWLDG